MPLQVVEAVARSGRYTRTHAAPTRYTCTPKSAKVLYISIASLYYFFKVRKEKHINMLMHPQELNPYKPPDNAKKGAICALSL